MSRKRKTEEEREQEFLNWSQSDVGKGFYAWWKEHRYSGYGVNQRGQQRFGIPPYEAWGIWKYKAEFFVENGDAFPWPEGLDQPNLQDIEKWCLEQQTTEARTKALERRLGREFWKKMEPNVWYAEFKKIAHELVKANTAFDRDFEDLVCYATKSMKEKIDNAYAYEPGQSEEETEALRRRRE